MCTIVHSGNDNFRLLSRRREREGEWETGKEGRVTVVASAAATAAPLVANADEFGYTGRSFLERGYWVTSLGHFLTSLTSRLAPTQPPPNRFEQFL